MVYFYGGIGSGNCLPSWAKDDQYLSFFITDILAGKKERQIFVDFSKADVSYYTKKVCENGAIFEVNSHLDDVVDKNLARAFSNIIVVDDDVYFIIKSYGNSSENPMKECNGEIIADLESKLGPELTFTDSKINKEKKKTMFEQKKQLLAQKYLIKGLSAIQDKKINEENMENLIDTLSAI